MSRHRRLGEARAAAALNICESLILTLIHKGLLSKAEALDLLADVDEAQRELFAAEPDDGTARAATRAVDVIAASVGQANPGGAERTRSGRRCVILIVDDDPDVRATTNEILGRRGYEVVEAASASEALLELQRHETIDLLFTDIIMPGKDGLSLAREAMMLRPGLKVLLTTGFMERLAEGHETVLPHKIIKKPWTVDQLDREVAGILAG